MVDVVQSGFALIHIVNYAVVDVYVSIFRSLKRD